MANNKKRKTRKRFIAVDVWRSEFGPVSTGAIHDVFAQKFNVEPHNARKYSFSHCVNALRRLEDPDYKDPKDSQSY